jgi:hypothetical protein
MRPSLLGDDATGYQGSHALTEGYQIDPSIFRRSRLRTSIFGLINSGLHGIDVKMHYAVHVKPFRMEIRTSGRKENVGICERRQVSRNQTNNVCTLSLVKLPQVIIYPYSKRLTSRASNFELPLSAPLVLGF